MPLVRRAAGGGRSLAAALLLAPALFAASDDGVADREAPATASVERLPATDVPRRSESVVVTAERAPSRIGETAASVTALVARDLDLSAAPTVDDALRQVPGLTLFRRNGSRTANPTAQGVSLRGVGASGASRAVVLLDGLPLDDPFGGWVYWDRVPRAALARVEVVRGGASHLYGSDALGGVIQLLTKGSRPSDVCATVDLGSHGWSEASLFAASRYGPLGALLAAEAAGGGGHVLVGSEDRGPVDTVADGRHRSLDLALEVHPRPATRAFVRGSIFGERRENGTPLQKNRTHQRQLALGLDAAPSAGALTARVFVAAQVYDQTFSAVSSDRASESLTRLQRVPSDQAGASVQWSRAFGRRVALVAGIDLRRVDGTTDETGYSGGLATSESSAGGRADTGAVFVQGNFSLGAHTAIRTALRADAWRHSRGRVSTRPFSSNSPSVSGLPDRQEHVLSPQISVFHRLSPDLALFASAYRAFRTPTLNELYRSFRVGNVLTRANAGLSAEHLSGAEAGVGATAASGRLDLRAVAFWNQVLDPIANVTLETTPTLITRQRLNLGRTGSYGTEIEASTRLGRRLTLGIGYQWANARVRRFPADPSLEGRRLPQVAGHQGTLQARLTLPRGITLSLQGRAAGPQFDDDQNLLELAGYLTLDALVALRVAARVELFGAVENVLDKPYEVGRTPIPTYGPPLQARFGLRFIANRRR